MNIICPECKRSMSVKEGSATCKKCNISFDVHFPEKRSFKKRGASELISPQVLLYRAGALVVILIFVAFISSLR